ncbi:TonB-linked outer membrane protein, SusC/RagA family [Sphingobacterium nematocida]|uniref:TonB-linked outer membrane protein, SusC/RagA family n=1 Tax=Sphingobacterium nematocida TaxID=1513896 RepID=A0A1T5GED0_9SPHI|nr:SusC/RagA family TonB-linked outer membrane protein [Sphingobacterium nematocida]SKC06769.1 TonB-linked outer membrane protein, SusC/RagA family [Sphingobacterium nematocida]
MYKHINLKSIICLLVQLFILSAFAQQKQLTGKVYEQALSNPFAQVSILFVSSSDLILTAYKSEKDGSFQVNIPVNATKVVFSTVGYLKQEFHLATVSGRLNVVMKIDDKQIEEVEIVANAKPDADLGFVNINKRELSSSIASIDMKGIENLPVVSVDQFLQGMAPGLQVVSNSGDPGAAASIRIRGISSISGINDPLWIIDGAEVIGNNYSVQSISDFGFSPIGDLDPSDIASIDILKDASATALYGSKGANGVIVIRTKRGKRGKPVFNFNGRFTLSEVPRSIPMLNGDEHRIYSIERWTGGSDDGSALPELRGDMTRADAWKFNNNTDWLKAISRTGIYQQYNTSLSGGGDRINYYWGLGYTNQYGTTKGTGYDRFNTRFNMNYRVSDKLSITADLTYTNSLTDKRGTRHPYDINANNEMNPLRLARQIPAYFPMYSKNGLDYFVDRNAGVSFYSRFNPLALIDYSQFLSKANRLMASTSINYKILSNLEFTTQVSTDFREASDDYFLPSYATDAIPGESTYNAGMQSEGYQLLVNNVNKLMWKPIDKEKHRLTVTGVANLSIDKSNNMEIRYFNGASPQLRSADASARISAINGGYTDQRYLGMFVQGHYALLDRYFLTVTGKTEGDSRYGNENAYTIFPAIGAAWDMTRERAIRNAEWISTLKPRFAFGITGNLPKIANIYDIAYATKIGYMGQTYIYPDKFAYENIKEERTTEYNLGLDFGFLKDRITGQFDIYKRTTNDLLLKESLSSTLGYANQYVNFGTVENSGIELGVTVDVLRGGKDRPRLKSFFNIALNRNKLIKLPENFDAASFAATRNGFASKLQEGDVIGGFYGYRALGVYARDEDAYLKDAQGNLIYEADGSTPKIMRYGSVTGHQFKGGDMIYADINGDGVINQLDRVQIGNANPTFFGGWNNTLSYNKYTLAVNLQYQFGNDIINGTRMIMEEMSDSKNQAQSILSRWRRQGDVTDMPKAQPSSVWNSVASTRWVEDGSYVRLKSVSFTYEAGDLLKRWGLKQLSFFVTGYNLLTWTNYLGVDPEVPIKGSVYLFGIDDSYTAPPKQYTFGFRFNL